MALRPLVPPVLALVQAIKCATMRRLPGMNKLVLMSLAKWCLLFEWT